ncbi:MAG TPA: glycosyltransferase family 2 protein, partial [Opitutaceae bacterium]|nr:glycosyltransferase family 2 protein [Opitutaceae bacterium]
MKKISAIIACYRDQPAIPIMHARLKNVFARIGVVPEIIFVNDASPDNSRAVLTELAAQDPQVIVINHSRNFGTQSAFTSGMKIATGDAVVCLDGDLQDPPELIADFHARWLEGYDVVYGERVQRQETLPRRWAYKAFYRVLHAVSYVDIPVDAGDFALLDRKVVDALNALPENNRFLRGLRSWVGYRQIGVPHVRPDRMFGRSNFSLTRYFSFARKGILSFSYVPLDLITWLALSIVGLSFLGAVWQFYWRLAFPERVPQGFTTVIIIVLFLGGVQLLCLSVIGSYISHIYDEVKRRPAFIVESILNDPRKKRSTQRNTTAVESYAIA